MPGSSEEVAVNRVSGSVMHNFYIIIIMVCTIMWKAKQILRRVEMRDLYNCVWKLRVPKMLAGDHDLGGHHHNGHLWRVVNTMKVKSQGELIYALLDEGTKQRITLNNLWIEVCRHPLPIKCYHAQLIQWTN